mmetsp:Transcript_11362/g.28734  ORF Transcript_11362/g.28734 Transcript_11362/m.28734 type:complete len:565 (-) Transcript_11362:73-1767(-)
MKEVQIQPRRCSYCDRAEKKLKMCSRCQKVWYCNVECQKDHFSVHKKDCKKWSAQKTKPKNAPNQVKFVVQEREGRGKCLAVSCKIPRGERIQNRDGDRWEALVLPALDRDHRTYRCALCFCQLEGDVCFFDLPPNPLYPMLFCSKDCRRVAKTHGLEQEARDGLGFFQSMQGGGPNHIYPIAVIIYRILIRQACGDAQIRDQVLELQGTPKREESNDTMEFRFNANDISNEKEIHTHATLTIAMGMLQSSGRLSHYNPRLEYLVEMVHRIKVNGFSIYANDTQVCGVGLYGTPSFMNHSCRPNALRICRLQKSRPPFMYITAFQDILKGEEICISYMDTSCPSHMRLTNLEKDYYFVCNCKACDTNSDQQDDSVTMALRCPNCPSSTVIRADKGLAPRRPVYECTECHNTNFESALLQLRDFERTENGDLSLSELRTTYERLQKICYNTSWYVQEAGHRLLEEHLEKLAELAGDFEQQKAREALKLAQELLDAKPQQLLHSTGAFLNHQHLRHKAAKLLLFLDPDPRRSIQELQGILASLTPFYSDDHSVVAEVKATLARAIM